uniref:Uncharacterized protein n=1 Tax=Aegilops tauschii subsp. strangulata TaxID=200361 RepID=A0A453KW14_AEGTS
MVTHGREQLATWAPPRPPRPPRHELALAEHTAYKLCPLSRNNASSKHSATQQQSETEGPSTPPPNKPKASTSIWDALAFSGPAPERINGRLAMVGFVTALAVEAGRGDGLLSQLGSGTGQAWFAYSVAVLSVASLVPLLQGESAEGRAGAIMNANAELWNGRFAMLGLVALAATEIITGAPFINV